MAKQWKILARHKWVAGAVIAESVDTTRETKDVTIRRFTATIRGWRNWLIFEGNPRKVDIQDIINKVREIRDRIDSGDDSIFTENVTIKEGLSVDHKEPLHMTAKRKARYGHRDWLHWVDKNGVPHIGKTSIDSIQSAINDVGENGKFSLYAASTGTPHLITPPIAKIMLNNAKVGIF